ncbi:MAG TPA: prenyltransferase/squalene oxidase repeat-containing protein [Candidatus Angelobacter sp.]|nr:prenyltransferase/squalene oxidase repeat-containing protein [Candidatus Angelobacter sp.]
MAEKFIASSVPSFDPSVSAQSERIIFAQGLGVRHLIEHFKVSQRGDEGFFNSPVSSRVLESALMLHLLRRIETETEWQHQLECYLRVNMDRADAIGSIAAKAVMNLPLDSGIWERTSLFAGNAEYGLRRKRALLAMLLVELGVISFTDARLFIEDYSACATHLFSRIYAASLRLLHHRYQPLETSFLDDITYLTRTQNVNGSWEQQVLTTMFAMLALGPGHSAFTRGLTYLRGLKRQDGGMPFIDNQNIWVSCVAGLALQSARLRTQTAVEERLAKFIVERQHENGSWSFADGVTQTDTDVSANCTLVLLQQKSSSYRNSIERAIRYFRELQRPDRGYPTYERDGESEVTMTANVLHALNLAMSQAPSPRYKLERAADYLASRQRVDGSFETSWSRSETYSIFRVLWALDIHQRTTSTPQRSSLVLRSLKYLFDTQHKDGGWGQSAAVPSDALSTAYGISALCLISNQHQVETKKVSTAVAYLLSQQNQSTGAFHSIPDVAGPRPIPFDTPLLRTVWPVLALNFVTCCYPGMVICTSDQAA